MNPAPLQEAIKELDTQIALHTAARDSLRVIVQTLGPSPATAWRVTVDAPKVIHKEWRRAAQKMRKPKRGPYKKAKAKPAKPPGAKWDPRGPLTTAMVEAGRKAKEPFGAKDLIALSDCTMKEGANALIRWKTKGWVISVVWGKYKRTEGFGDQHVETAEESARKQPPEKATEIKPPSAAPAEEKLTPYSRRGIELADKLKTEFTVDELGTLLPNGKPGAYYWVSQWRNRSWVEKQDFDVYRKTKEFGQC